MATIEDIAKLAGVSHGTVSNVLNKTGKVSLEKVKLVENAIEQLGYTYNAHARYLRQGSRRLIDLVIPTLQVPCYRTLYESLQKCLRKNEYEIQVYETDNLAACEERIVDKFVMTNPGAIVTVSSLPNAAFVYNGIACPKIYLNRYPGTLEQDGENCYASFDYMLAGKDIAACIVSKECKSVALIMSPSNTSDETALFNSIERELGKDISCMKTALTVRIAQNQAMTFLMEHPYVDCIVTFDECQAEIFYSAAQVLGIQNIPKLICISDYTLFGNDHYMAYQMNYFQAGCQIGEHLLYSLSNGKTLPSQISFHCQGFRHAKHSIEIKDKESLSMINLQSPTTEALKMLSPQFERETGIKLNITSLPHDSLLTQIEMLDSNSYADLIRIDITWFSEFAEKLYRPLEDLLPQQAVIPSKQFLLRYPEYMRLGSHIYCLPFDPSVLILLYRQDLFEDAVIKRSYYEQNNVPLNLPQNFTEYNKIAAFFTRAYNPASPVPYGTALAYGTGPLAVVDFLIRLISTGDTIMHNGRIDLNTSNGLYALSNYIEAAKYAPPYDIAWWPQVVQELAEGRCAMVTSFSNHASYMQDQNLLKMAGKIGCSEIPGGKSLLGGGPIGISRFSNKLDECLAFFNWYYSEETASAIVSLGGLSPRTEVLSNYDYSLYPWLSTSSESFQSGIRGLTKEPIPGFPLRRFEYLLGNIVRDCVKENKSPEKTLKYIQDSMNQIFPYRIDKYTKYL
ncbi:MAG: extracellular solute-binding protein [Firmicutes bacterium]|nr:extracellular solute-binding protein [Bacillota bacterium]